MENFAVYKGALYLLLFQQDPEEVLPSDAD